MEIMEDTSGVTNIFIDSVLRSTISRYHGVFSCDNIPFCDKDIFLFVANLSKYGHAGTHFVAVCINSKTKIAEYFDPFGHECENPDILKYMQNYVTKVQGPMFQVQSYLSDFCGIHCIAYMFSKQLKTPITRFLKMYSSTDLLFNDVTSAIYIMKSLEI